MATLWRAAVCLVNMEPQDSRFPRILTTMIVLFMFVLLLLKANPPPRGPSPRFFFSLLTIPCSPIHTLRASHPRIVMRFQGDCFHSLTCPAPPCWILRGFGVILSAPCTEAAFAVKNAKPPSFHVIAAATTSSTKKTPVLMAAITPVDRAVAAGKVCAGENVIVADKEGQPKSLIPSHRTIMQHGPGEIHGAKAAIEFL